MANQTVTTVVNYDDASISGLLDGETLTINGGSVTINSDVRWNQQAAVFGSVTLSSSLGGSFLIDGTTVWELHFDASTGNVPTQDVLDSNTVTGSGGATGELLRVWGSDLEPLAAGVAMPATGWIKLRSKTGTFADNEIVTLPGGATITLTGPGKRSWINVVGREATALTIPRLGTFTVEGDWYEIGLTDGTDNQQLQFPVADECSAIQIETGPSTGVYEWWINGGGRWIGNVLGETQTVNGTTAALNNIPGPPGAMAGGQFSQGHRLRETATNAVHGTAGAITANTSDPGNFTYRVWVKRETRQWCVVQAVSGTNRYGVLIDLDAGTIIETRTVGSPTGTSQSITSQGNGWFEVELTLDHDALANTGAINIFISNSATPAYDANGLPTYLGSTAEGMYYTEPLILVPYSTIATDERGKVFYSDVTAGLITLARRDGSFEAGLKPPSGCRVRIGNVILSSANPVDYTRNTQNTGVTSRYDLSTTAGGSLSFRKTTCNWYTASTSPYSVLMEDSAFALGLSFTNVASTTTLTRIATGPSRATVVAGLIVSGCFSGGTITDCTFTRYVGASNAFAAQLTVAKDFTVTRTKTLVFSTGAARLIRTTTSYCWSVTDTENVIFTDCINIGGGFSMSAANNTRIENLKYADVASGSTLPVTVYAIALLRTDGFILDGFSTYTGIDNVHPYAGIMSTSTSCANIELRNVGTATAPFNAGTVNPMGLFAAFLSTTVGATMRRVYGDNLRTAAISTTNTVQNLRLYNVWADGADSQVMVAVDTISQGCRWSNPGTVQNSVYGTHWEDAFISETEGRLTIFGNEPIASTTDQCSFTFGAGAGFTSAGGVSLPNLTDTVTWTMPYYAIGHTGIAATATRWFVTGTAQQSLEFDYQIDTGSGFGTWKHLVNQARRSAGGSSGTNTVTLNSTDRASLIRQPQIGDYVQSSVFKLPDGTTVTDVTGDVVTVSNNFTAGLSANELIHFWSDIADEVIDPEDGYKLKVRVKVNTVDPTNLLTFLRIPFDTDAVNQRLAYPLPTTQNIGQITNIRAGSRLQIYNVTTATEVVNELVPGTTFSYSYDEGTDFTDGDLIRIRLARCLGATASIGYEGLAVANGNGWSLFAAQDDDEIYNSNGIDGTAVTEFTFDYPNIQVDINDPDGQTTLTRLYAWWANERTTQQGIRTLIGGLVAEDEANYKIISSRIDLKLDNSSSTGVIFTGDLRIYRDDGAVPVVSSTSGGGSITLYAGKVYTSIVSTASPVITGDITDVPAAVQSGMTAQGYTSSRAAKIENIPSEPATQAKVQEAVNAAKLAAALSS